MTNILNAATAVDGAVSRRARSRSRCRASTIDAQRHRQGRLERHQERHRARRGSTVTLPAALNVANTSLIWARSQYAYTPTIGYVDHRHDDAEGPDLHAAAAVRHR